MPDQRLNPSSNLAQGLWKAVAATTMLAAVTGCGSTDAPAGPNARGNSGTGSVGITQSMAPALTQAPTDLVATALGSTQIKLTWTDQAAGVTSIALRSSPRAEAPPLPTSRPLPPVTWSPT
jgi:hypothetical protein